MSQKFKLSYWQSGSGRWYCNNISAIAKWYIPMRLMKLSIEEYIDLLVNKFHAKIVHYNDQTDCLIYYFSSERDAKSYCSYVNKAVK